MDRMVDVGHRQVAKTADIITLRPIKALGRPKVRSDEAQRDIVIRQAMDIFLDVGFSAMKMDDIAAECRISKRTLYRLFPSKLGLFGAMVERHRHSMLVFPPSLAALPLEAALAEIFRLDLDGDDDCRRMAFIHRALSEVRQVPELADILHVEGGEKARRRLAEWLAERSRSDALRLGDPASAASMLMDMVFGAIALKPAEISRWPGGVDRRAYLRECIRYFVNGIK